jgi:hypothetical protein
LRRRAPPASAAKGGWAGPRPGTEAVVFLFFSSDENLSSAIASSVSFRLDVTMEYGSIGRRGKKERVTKIYVLDVGSVNFPS